MKKIFTFLLLFVSSFLFAQTGQWTWVNGDSALNSSGSFGTQGIASPTNSPPAVYQCNFWTDHNGNFWLFGGFDSAYASRNDLWKYDAAANEWTWMKGLNIGNDTGHWGTMGVSAPLNNPASRSFGSASWVDSSGNLWLFGGSSTFGYSNDMWKYDIGSNEWTWVRGAQTGFQTPVYGVQGVPSVTNDPGSRVEMNASWIDNSGNFWFYGSQGDTAYQSDMWRYNPSTNEWTWMQGAQAANLQPVWGIKNVASATNTPGARFAASKWKDCNGNLWLYGGASTGGGVYTWNDLWEYDLSINEWIWKHGPNVANQPGNMTAGKCVSSAANLPFPAYEGKACWEVGNLFFFYAGYDLVSGGTRNDLWCYDVSLDRWILVNGNAQVSALSIHGTLNVSSPLNQPGSRMGAVGWYDGNGWLYLFGGGAKDLTGKYNDVFKFQIDTSCTRLSGSSLAAFQASDTIICANDCINFTDLSANAASWQWTFEGGTPATSSQQSPQSVCYQAGGNYNVTLTITNTCQGNTLIKNNYISVHPAPATPTITQHGDTLYCSTDPTYTSYQWYYTGIIPGATDTFYVASQSGNYNVKVTDHNGCSIAVGTNVVIGLNEQKQDEVISLYPDPAGDELFIINRSIQGSKSISIFNAIGEKIFSNTYTEGRDEVLNIANLSAGIYFVLVANESDKWMGRFVKE